MLKVAYGPPKKVIGNRKYPIVIKKICEDILTFFPLTARLRYSFLLAGL